MSDKKCLASSLEEIAALTREQVMEAGPMQNYTPHDSGEPLLTALHDRVRELFPEANELREAFKANWDGFGHCSDEKACEALVERARGLPPLVRIEFWSMVMIDAQGGNIEPLKWLHARFTHSVMSAWHGDGWRSARSDAVS